LRLRTATASSTHKNPGLDLEYISLGQTPERKDTILVGKGGQELILIERALSSALASHEDETREQRERNNEHVKE
jgi:hypothetical protein